MTHPAKEVAKILREIAKNNDIKASIRSERFAHGNAVRVRILSGSDSQVELFKTMAKPFGWERTYEAYEDCGIGAGTIVNLREDIPQTHFLTIYDKRAK